MRAVFIRISVSKKVVSLRRDYALHILVFLLLTILSHACKSKVLFDDIESEASLRKVEAGMNDRITLDGLTYIYTSSVHDVISTH